jgi:hypothetical protein
MKNLVLTVIALWSYSAFAQAQHGTVIVVNFTKDKVIIAADSRAMNSDNRRPPDDCRCNISAFGKKIVFTTSGDLPRNFRLVAEAGPRLRNLHMLGGIIMAYVWRERTRAQEIQESRGSCRRWW